MTDQISQKLRSIKSIDVLSQKDNNPAHADMFYDFLSYPELYRWDLIEDSETQANGPQGILDDAHWYWSLEASHIKPWLFARPAEFMMASDVRNKRYYLTANDGSKEARHYIVNPFSPSDEIRAVFLASDLDVDRYSPNHGCGVGPYLRGIKAKKARSRALFLSNGY